MRCKLRLHQRGTRYEYDGEGLVYELCGRCYKLLDAIPLEDFEYADDLLFYLELTTT